MSYWRKIKNDPEKAEDLSREINSCKKILEAKLSTRPNIIQYICYFY